MEIQALGRIRKLLESIDAGAPGDEEQLTLTPQLELLVAQSAAPYREIVRNGHAFVVSNTTAVASVVAIPTTAVNLALYNNEPDGGRSYVIDFVAAVNRVSTAVTCEAQIIVYQGQSREAVPAGTTLGIRKLNGNGSAIADATTLGADTKVITITGTTLTQAGIASTWAPLGPSCAKPGATAVGGYGVFVPVDGRFMCPPGRYFAINVMANVASETFMGTIGWHEVQTQIG